MKKKSVSMKRKKKKECKIHRNNVRRKKNEKIDEKDTKYESLKR